MTTGGTISLRGVEVHNLKHVDLDLPRGKLIVFCGVSGSGKSSLAFDTLYAEGQRRYIESFSAYTRQFLERLEKPAAERIDGIPPALAVTSTHQSRSSRSTVGTVTETADYLRLLFAKVGQVHCLKCGQLVKQDSPQSAAEACAQLPEGTPFLVAFVRDEPSAAEREQWVASLREDGFVRIIYQGKLQTLDQIQWPAESAAPVTEDVGDTDDESKADEIKSDDNEDAVPIVLDRESGDDDVPVGDAEEDSASEQKRMPFAQPIDVAPTPFSATAVNGNGRIYVVIDRLKAGAGSAQRLRDSLELAFERGHGRAFAFVEADAEQHGIAAAGVPAEIDGRAWKRYAWSSQLRCEACELEYPWPEPRLFSFNSPLGACPICEGFGNVVDVDMERVVPDARKSLRDGAIAPWNTPAYKHELEELLALADEYNIPLDVPFSQLTESQLALIRDGVPERNFGGMKGFFQWLERRKYKMHIRVFLSRWRSYRTCPSCGGSRLRPEALATTLGGKNIAQVFSMRVGDAIEFFAALPLSEWEKNLVRVMLEQIRSRLAFLSAVGLDYLSLDRTLRTLSTGESHRVALTSAMGSSLVNMLYVLDEPSEGLHPRDTDRLTKAIQGLRDRGNTVVVVEHDETLIRKADQVVEIGPGAGERGGQVVFQGPPGDLLSCPTSITGDFLAGRRGVRTPTRRRTPNHGWIRLAGARGNNLKNLTVEFPLGVLCVVTGVSGAGKSTLVQDTLYPALCRRLRKETIESAPYDDVFGDGQIDDVQLVDQSPIGRSPRSNPVTYVKAFDEIRSVFAETLDARTRNYTASHFSFNVAGGRCNVCEGDGYLQVDMQFMADVFVPCSQCGGRRYRQEILDITYRGRNIAEVLEMTVREAFTFFRGHTKVQARLKRLIDVGLDYLRLGQPANTLSGGEAQRLKLAAYMPSASRNRCLFILEEPTTGLHFADVLQLLDCFEALLSVGHSLVVVEHNLDVIKFADHVIDLGPGAADEGGSIVGVGTPEVIARTKQSITGKFLAPILARSVQEQSA